MKIVYSLLFSIAFSLPALAVKDSLFIAISDVSSSKILPVVNQDLSALTGVNVVSYCPGKNVLFVIVDRALQPDNQQIDNVLSACMGGRLTFYFKQTDTSGYSSFVADCEEGIKRINVTGQPLDKTD